MRDAWEARGPLLERLHAEGTDSYRLFHGVAEGWPGVAVDRYGPRLVLHSFRDPVSAEQELVVRRFYEERSEARFDSTRQRVPGEVARELGLRYAISKHRFFLDLRVLRRWLLQNAGGKSFLNLCCYTGGAGLCARRGGATQVLNVDFSAGNLAVARQNAELNGLEVEHLQEDIFPVLWQLAGLPVKGRGARRGDYRRLSPGQFDLILLDPPGFSKGRYAAVDLARDYQSLFKPCLRIAAPGATIIACNNLAEVPREDFLASLERCASKAGRPLAGLELLEPEADFPSPDGRPPLKIALARV